MTAAAIVAAWLGIAAMTVALVALWAANRRSWRAAAREARLALGDAQAHAAREARSREMAFTAMWQAKAELAEVLRDPSSETRRLPQVSSLLGDTTLSHAYQGRR